MARRGLTFFIVFCLIFPSQWAWGRGTVTVALVPYAEQASPPLVSLIAELGDKLRRTKGIRVLPQAKTNELLGYYFSYVRRVAAGRPAPHSLSDAREALLAGDYSRAEQLLQKTAREIDSRVASGGSNEGLYEIALLQAKIFHAHGDADGVGRAYERIVHLYPEIALDPNLYSKWERKALEAALHKIEGLRVHSVSVTSQPEGAEVFLNGVHRGIAPLTLKKLPPGRYCIEVKTVHHAPYVRYVDVEGGKALQLKTQLARTGVAAETALPTVSPSLYRTDLEISRLIATLGYHLGVDKVILVATQKDAGGSSLVYRLGDTQLGAVYKPNRITMNERQPTQTVRLAANEIQGEARFDVLKDPAEVATQSVGSIKLHEKRRPFYKRPLFWILVGAGAATGGALGAVLGGAGGAATGGVVIGL